jgi:hypothetical protein
MMRYLKALLNKSLKKALRLFCLKVIKMKVTKIMSNQIKVIIKLRKKKRKLNKIKKLKRNITFKTNKMKIMVDGSNLMRVSIKCLRLTRSTVLNRKLQNMMESKAKIAVVNMIKHKIKNSIFLMKTKRKRKVKLVLMNNYKCTKKKKKNTVKKKMII